MVLARPPLLGRQLARWCARAVAAQWLDPSTLKNEVLPHFIAVDVSGGADPCPQRWGIIRGTRDTVPTADAPKDPYTLPGDHPIHTAGNLLALENKYGGLLDQHRRIAVRKIRDEIERVRMATEGNRHPTYKEAQARVDGLCRYWAMPLDLARAKLEEAYLATLTPDEARKRHRGSTKGVPDWLDRRTPA